MKEFKKRSLVRRIIFSRFVFLILVAVAVVLGLSVYNAYKIERTADTIKNNIGDELNELSGKQKQLEASLDKLSSESGIEEELRNKLQVKKPGEELVIIIEDKNGEAGIFSPEMDQPVGFFETFFKKFFSIFK